MPQARLKYQHFNKGLYITGSSEMGPADTLRRATGVRGRYDQHIISRLGSSTFPGGVGHSLHQFQSNYYVANAAGTLVRGVVSPPGVSTVHSGLTGKRIFF